MSRLYDEESGIGAKLNLCLMDLCVCICYRLKLTPYLVKEKEPFT